MPVNGWQFDEVVREPARPVVGRFCRLPGDKEAIRWLYCLPTLGRGLGERTESFEGIYCCAVVKFEGVPNVADTGSQGISRAIGQIGINLLAGNDLASALLAKLPRGSYYF